LSPSLIFWRRARWEPLYRRPHKGKGGRKPSFLFAYTGLARLGLYIAGRGMKLSPEQDRERLAQWLRNADDYDDWLVGLEPIPGDHTWTKEKAPDGAWED